MSQHQRMWRLAEFCGDLLGCLDVFGRGKLPTAKKSRKWRPGMELLEDRVVPTDTAPVASDWSFSVHMNSSSPFDLASHGSDADGDSIHATIVSNPVHGTISGSTYTPDQNFVGSDSFQFKVTDYHLEIGENGNSTITMDSNVATCTIDVTDTAPTAAGTSLSVEHGGTTSAINLLA